MSNEVGIQVSATPPSSRSTWLVPVLSASVILAAVAVGGLVFLSTNKEQVVLKSPATEPSAKQPIPAESEIALPPGCILQLSFDKGSMTPVEGNLKRWKVQNPDGGVRTISINGTVQAAKGQIGGGWLFDGKTYVSIDGPFPSGRAARTIASWIKMDWTGGVRQEYLFWYGSGDREHDFGLYYHRTHEKFTFVDGMHDLYLRFPVEQQWTHVAITYDGIQVTCYCNGRSVEVAERQLKTATGHFYLGTPKSGWTNSFRGVLDEVCVFDRALSDDEVSQLAKRGVEDEPSPPSTTSSTLASATPAPPAGCVMHLSFDKGSFKPSPVNQSRWTTRNPNGTTRVLERTGNVEIVPGVAGDALHFDGKSRATVDGTLPIGNAPRTLACWIKWDGKVDPDPQKHQYFIRYGTGDTNSSAFGLLAFATDRRILVALGADMAFEAFLSPERWHHCAVTYDGTTIQGYFNGTKCGSDTRQIDTKNTMLQVGWGCHGSIDEVFLFDRALSDDEVLQLSKQGVGGESLLTPSKMPKADTTTSSEPPPAIAPFSAEQAKQHQQAWARFLGVPVNQTLPNDSRVVLIPPGQFLMGGKPMTISRPFYMGIHEVSVAQFRRFVEATGYKTEAEKNGGWGWNDATKEKIRVRGIDWKSPHVGRTPSEREPVGQIVPLDAVAYCDWLSKTSGVPCRLPSDAEWEFACRAGTISKWFFGDDPAASSEFAWLGTGKVHEIMLKKQNPFGLFDLYGNPWDIVSLPSIPDPKVVNYLGRGGSSVRTAEGADSSTRLVITPQNSPDAFFSFRVVFEIAVTPVSPRSSTLLPN